LDDETYGNKNNNSVVETCGNKEGDARAALKGKSNLGRKKKIDEVNYRLYVNVTNVMAATALV
jgi:hypothetical protein